MVKCVRSKFRVSNWVPPSIIYDGVHTSHHDDVYLNGPFGLPINPTAATIVDQIMCSVDADAQAKGANAFVQP